MVMLVRQVHYEARGDGIPVRFQARHHGEVGNLQRKKTARGVQPPTQAQWNARRCRCSTAHTLTRTVSSSDLPGIFIRLRFFHRAMLFLTVEEV
jgi:hypothetical protein